MKVRVTLKDPDGFYDGVQEAAKQQCSAIDGLDEDERELLLEKRVERIGEAMESWVEYSEYVTLEFDIEAGTAIVVPRR
jgi:hypothetical protein